MASKEAAVRPKTGSRERPYSVSKDEAYARQLNRELNQNTFEEDEELARQIQKELEEEQAHADEELARRLHEEEHSPGMVYMPGGESGMPLENLFQMVLRQMREDNTLLTEHDEADEESPETPAAPADALLEGATGQRHSFKAAVAGSKSPERKRRGLNASRSPERPLRGRGRGRSAAVGRGETPITEQGPGTHPRPHLPNMQQVPRGRGQSSEESETVSGRPGFPRYRRVRGRLRFGMHEPNLPDGEFDPDMVHAERSERAEDFVSIMRDPFLLMMMLMNRDPRMLVPEDIDFSDYESLWELAERLGEVKGRGLKEEDIAQLPARTHRTDVGKKDRKCEKQCSICLTEFKSGEKILLLPCEHEFHADCIPKWLKRNATCPICRHEVKPKNSSG
ncbi:hypothetical protein CHS0354_001396 [Potamilus streckersoni]|uniref:RING-type domain-containing protein n=1 Tax=Potamilus streckersoni TaxID=2493646 RepID=A0AAE0W8S0_9BIVA|nr:hypothetical protein CHS0354_001396 [Potamilus streckersoni]